MTKCGKLKMSGQWSSLRVSVRHGLHMTVFQESGCIGCHWRQRKGFRGSSGGGWLYRFQF